MISVRKQEFIEMFLLGLVFLAIGVLGYIIKNNIINFIAFMFVVCYSNFTFIKRKLKKQQDDDDSLQNKYHAGYFTFFILLVILTIFIGVMIIFSLTTGEGFYTTFTIDLNFLCIVLGVLIIIYYLAFMYFDRTE